MAQTKTILPTIEKVDVNVNKDKAIDQLNKEVISLTNDVKNLTKTLTTYRQLVTILLGDLNSISNTVNRSSQISNYLLTKEEN